MAWNRHLKPDWLARIRERLYSAVMNLSTRTARVSAATLVILLVGSMPVAAAPLDDVGEAMCGSGLGQLVGIIIAGIALYLLVRAVLRGMLAFDKMGSSRTETTFEGKQQLVGAGKTAVGAFIPTLAVGIFELMGISTVSCINLNTGVTTIVISLA